MENVITEAEVNAELVVTLKTIVRDGDDDGSSGVWWW